MNRIKYILLFISILLLPVIVHGEECNPGSISITSIELNSISGKAKEITSPTVNNNKINLDLKLNDVGDIVEYNININNSSNEDYYFDKDILKDTSEYVDYSLEYDNNIVKSNSNKNIKLKVEYKNEVPPVDGDSLELDDTKELNLFLSNNNEIGVPNTGINIKSLILVISLLIVISLALYKTNKKTYILIGTILMLPVITNAICKANIEINSSVKIARPVPVTSTIYWALQDNDSDSINETLIISDHEIDGVLKGSFAGDTEFTSAMEVPWTKVDLNDELPTGNFFSRYSENVRIEGIVSPASTAYWFYGVGYNATTFEADLSNLITNNITNMEGMFAYAGRNAETWSIGNLSNWNTEKVTNMNGMFAYAGYNSTTFNLDISNWDTSNVTSMSGMFNFTGYKATTFTLDVSNWDTSQVTDMSGMFSNVGWFATTFNLDLSSWDTSKVTNMSEMFSNAASNATTFELDLSNWDTSKVTNMSNMFSNAGFNATTWSIGNLSNWNTAKVTNMSNMFSYAGMNATTFNLDLSNWDTSKVTNMSNMFSNAGRNAETWNIGDISNWDTSNVTNMSSMFYCAGLNATTFNLDISNWNTSNVTDMSKTFSYAGQHATNFSLNLLNWNTSNVTNMYSMFNNTGKNATSWQTFIPKTNGNGINNTTSRMYGNSTSKYVEPDTGKSFTLAN